MKRTLISILFTGLIFLAVGQNVSSNTSLKSLTKLDVGLQGVGFTYEPRLSNKLTIDLSVGAGGGYDVYEGGVGYEWNIIQPAFYFSVTPKFFYNRKNPAYTEGKTLEQQFKEHDMEIVGPKLTK